MADPDDALDVAAVRPELDGLAHAVVRSRAAAALFGVTAAVTVGRYRVLARAGAGGGGEVWSAWDPELDRRVALKLIAVRSSPAMRARVRAEGQALARLSHPNVVPVHDVIDHGEHVVLVMELVDGVSLRGWVAEDRTARQVVRAYRQVADGLAAMHAAGLIHRDVKPDNAVVGADGRIRVIDLGLATTAGAEPAGVAGTPRYMAPEQAAGEPVTPAVDQYGLCKSLQEALTRGGAAPPAWLVPILERGLASAPADRYPSMAALAAALAADPARRRRRIAIATIGLAAIGVAFAIGRSGAAGAARPMAPTCDGGAAALAQVWSADRRAAVGAHLATHATPYSAVASPALLAALDDYGAAWQDRFDGACRAQIAGDASPTLAERRARCLASAHAALGAVVGLASEVGAADLPALAQSVATLPDPERCADAAALLADVPPPPPAIAAAAGALSDRLAEVRVYVDAARPEAATLARAALETARTLDHAPLLARALVLDGRAQPHGGPNAAASFGAAVGVALAARDDALAVEAFARQLWATATSGDGVDAPDGLAIVEQLAARLTNGAFARALLANNLGVVALARGDRDRARVAFTDALALAGTVTGPDAVELWMLYTNLALVSDDDRVRTRLLDALLARRTRVLGPAHPRTLDVRITRGMFAAELDTAAQLLTSACADLARFHPGAGSHLADCWFELALVAEATGQPAVARDALARVLATAGSGEEPERIALARAHAARLDGDARAAVAAFTALRAQLADPHARWWIDVQRAEARLGRAQALLALGRRGEAGADASGAAAELAAIDARQRLPWIARRVALARALAASITTPTGSPR